MLVRINREARAIRLRDTDGNSIEAFGDTAKFWLIPTPSDAAPSARSAVPAAPAHTPGPIPAHAEQAGGRKIGITAVEELAARTAELATSYRLTDEAIAAGATPVPVRQTWADAGSPGLFFYYERGTQPGRPILATTTDGYRIHDVRTDQLIAHFASPVKMWIAAAHVPCAPAPKPVVVVVGCGRAKVPGRMPAARKYVGGFHAAARRAAAVITAPSGGQALIVSARYGLITLDTDVDDYDLCLGDPGAVTPARIAEQAAALDITGAAVTVLAGRRYADLVSVVWPDAARPLDGARGIGEQLARMKAITQQAADGLGSGPQPEGVPHD